VSNFSWKPHQKLFTSAKEKYPALFGGIGNGKTLAAVRKAIAKCTQEPNNLFLVGRLTYPELRDSTREMYMTQLDAIAREKGWPKNAYKFKSQENSVTFWNNSATIFRHLDQPRNLLSINLGGFYVDQAEEIDEEAFKTLQGRLRRKNIKSLQGFITGNPQGHNWVYKTYGMQDSDGKADFVYNTDYRMITAPTFANADNLPNDYIESLKRSYSHEWFERYINGSWDVFEGQIFDLTKVKGFDKVPTIYMTFAACDPAISKDTKACNTSFSVGGIAADGKIYDLETCAGKWSFYETLQQAERLIKKHSLSYLGVESVAYQKALLEACQRHFPNVNIIDLKADKDKFRRAKSISHIIDLGLYHTNDKELLSEMSAFVPDAPTDQKKDRVDALVHMLHLVQMYSPTRFKVKEDPYKEVQSPIEYNMIAEKERLKKVFEEEIAPFRDESTFEYGDGHSQANPNYY